MPLSSLTNQTIQLAAQSAFGTAATTGFKNLQSLSLMPNVAATVNTFRAEGRRFDGIGILNDEWSAISIAGVPDYNELVYLFCGAFGQVTPTRVIASTGLAYRWQWTISSTSTITPKYYTIESGDGTLADRVQDVSIETLTLEWTRGGASVGGSAFGSRVKDETNDAVTKTAGATDVAATMAPIASTHINIYVADTLAGLPGAAALGIPFRYAVSLGGLRGRATGLNRTTGGVDTTEGIPDPTLTLRLPTGATTRAMTAKMRSGARQFVRFEALGPNIEAGTPPNNSYKLILDTEAVLSGAVGEKGDENGAIAQDIPLRLAGAGLPNIDLVNIVATL